MVLSKEQVKHIAKLARLSLTEEEEERYASELSQILAYVETLQELDTKGVEPMVGAIEFKNVMREDLQVQTSADLRRAMLSNAPDSENTFIKVPQMTKVAE